MSSVCFSVCHFRSDTEEKRDRFYFILQPEAGLLDKMPFQYHFGVTHIHSCAFQIMHPEADEYFEAFDGFQYLPRARLKVLYPHG